MKIKFLGGTGTVTGSKYLIQANGRKILVDCGLFQGLKELRLRNWSDFPVDIEEIDAVLLTHAHIDHSGFLPVLFRRGYSGPIFSTAATKDLCAVLLPDAGKLQEEEAGYANHRGYSKHKPAEPLFTLEDGQQVLRLFKTVKTGATTEILPGVTARFDLSGHILGASMITLSAEGKTITFTGDLGRPEDLVMRPPSKRPTSDYLVAESTYGNRRHKQIDPFKELEEAVGPAIERGGVIIVPAFSVGRTQSLLYALVHLVHSKRIPEVPIFLNSPMSINAMHIYCNHKDEHQLTDDQCKAMCGVAKYVRSPEESKSLNYRKGPMIIVSASGMATGGRVIHHLKQFAPDQKNLILLTGFQAAGTRGEALVNGAKEIKIHGQMIPVRAEVQNLHSYSAHADQVEIVGWMKTNEHLPKTVFITHGEPIASLALKEKIESDLKWNVCIPEYLSEVELK